MEEQEVIVLDKEDIKYIDIEDTDLMQHSVVSKIFGSIVVFIVGSYFIDMFVSDTFWTILITIAVVFIYYSLLDEDKDNNHEIEIVRAFERDIYYLVSIYDKKLNGVYDIIFFSYKNLLIEVIDHEVTKVLYIKNNDIINDLEKKNIVDRVLFFQSEIMNINPEAILLGTSNIDILYINNRLNTVKIIPIRRKLRSLINGLLDTPKVEYNNDHLESFCYIYKDGKSINNLLMLF